MNRLEKMDDKQDKQIHPPVYSQINDRDESVYEDKTFEQKIELDNRLSINTQGK